MLRFFFLCTALLGAFSISAQSADSFPNSVNDSIQKREVILHADERVPALMERYKNENEGAKIDGYRVQLFSGDRKGAFNFRSEFITALPGYAVTVVYDSPNFKTQVGNFRTKLEAEKALAHIWPFYKSAFVVKTEIDLPALPIEQPE